MVKRVCGNPHCRKLFEARKADIKRGWAKCCSKSCAAVKRERVLDRHNYAGIRYDDIANGGGISVQDHDWSKQ